MDGVSFPRQQNTFHPTENVGSDVVEKAKFGLPTVLAKAGLFTYCLGTLGLLIAAAKKSNPTPLSRQTIVLMGSIGATGAVMFGVGNIMQILTVFALLEEKRGAAQENLPTNWKPNSPAQAKQNGRPQPLNY